MQKTFRCPICRADDWNKARTYTYDGRDHRPGGRWYDNAYVRLRRKILFDIWLPGCDLIVLTSQYCARCGFMCYTPRPDVSDLEEKYASLSRTEVNVGGQHDISDEALRLDRKRAMRIHREIGKTFPLAGKTVLDVGGGNGKLLDFFLKVKCRCFLVDYNRYPKPGIERLGNTVNDIPNGVEFDVLICSHVLEHVPNPMEFLADLRLHLKPDGKAYFEVPLQIWYGIPIEAEPVTHINFFTDRSFLNMLHCARFHVVRYGCGPGSYERYRMQIPGLLSSERQTKALLNPY
jgi:SAM-dependent methyltransferase